MAILAGSALIAAGLYFGLRARPVAIAPPSAPTNGTVPAASALPGGSSAPISTGGPSVVMQLSGVAPPSAADVNRDALASFEKQRPMLLDTCWKPAIASDPKAAPATYELDLAFDEAGREVGRGLSGREGATVALTDCIRMHSSHLFIPSRGTRAHARIRFTLP
jgi:hypothetical protein